MEYIKYLALGYMVGDILELKIAKLQRGRMSTVIIMFLLTIVLFLGIYLGQNNKNITEIFKPIIYQTIVFIIGMIMGLYREKVLRVRN